MTLMLLAVLAIVWTAVVCRRRFTERTLIVGTSPLARKICGELSGSFSPYRVVGVIDDLEGTPGDHQFGALLAGPLARLGPLIEELGADRIVVALVDRRGRLPLGELIDARVRGIAVEDGVAFYERLTGKIAIEALAPSHLFSSPDFRKGHLDLAFGHAFSLLVAVTALVALTPLFALLAAAIKLESRGPVFFVHERVGICGRRLRLLKFRTMHPAAAPTSEWVRDNGHRITRVGKWLRRCRLDELPQLINVVRGEMNLIGPRPHPASNFELFMRSIPYYSLRAVVRPGLTGWAQVRQGYANSLEEETEKMRYDLYYIKHMSVWLDLRILFATVLTVTTGRGSSAVTEGSRRMMPSSPGIRLDALRGFTAWLSAFAGTVHPQPIRARAATPLAIPAGGGETLEVGK